jgi:hypothetical protein
MSCEGFQIISDGTKSGTRLLIDGKPMSGGVEVNWKTDVANNAAEVCFTLRDLSIGDEAIASWILRALQMATNSLPSLTKELDEEEADPVAIGARPLPGGRSVLQSHTATLRT